MSNERPFDGELAGVTSRVPVDDYEIEREAVIAMLERERRSLTASLVALSLLAIGVAMLPNPGLMVVLLALRVVSFLFTRTAASRLEKKVRARDPLRRSRWILFGAMLLTGVTLALMLWPQPQAAPPVAVALIQIVIIVAITLISVTLAALPASRDAMLFAFWGTASALILLHPADIDPMLIAVITLGVTGVRIYSANTGQHMRSSARILVENRELSEDLADALAHAEFLSWRDPLTGLFNRRMLFEETRKERSARARHLLTIDLDRFKAINDTFGHGVGDHVLIAAADAIRDWSASLGDPDEHPAFRLGGEEFLVILRGLDDTAALDQAERLRMQISALEDQFTDHPGIAISASIGLSAWRFGESLDDALMRADIACYEAKNTGRNKVRRAA
ncbi:GGDEF domain-containing protein [Qipengyuania flava]|uniref:GGDEF domain-containing protein n=1 Tax=Qipengyuania flava TaxID=192812 RepID=UPI001C62CC29|nr:diguanylate cyclase [Qipengyuania flava]QYJ06408.1 diguanylate cyclase [Qipengyuania flava]